MTSCWWRLIHPANDRSSSRNRETSPVIRRSYRRLARGCTQPGRIFGHYGRQLTEAKLVERFTVAELAALARFYATPEGLSLARKGIAFTAAVTPMLEAEVVAWARSVRLPASVGGSAPS